MIKNPVKPAWKKIFVSVLLLSAVSNAFTATGDSKLEQLSGWELWRTGGEIYEDAEELQLAGNFKSAMKKYKEALNYFEHVRRRKTNWDHKVINRRIDLCQRRIKAVQKKIEDEIRNKILNGETALPVSGGKIADSGGNSSEIEGLKKIIKEYKNKLNESFIEIDRLKTEAGRNRASVEEVKKLLQEKLELQKENSLFRMKMDELAKKNSAGKISSTTEKLENRLVSEKMNFDELSKNFKEVSQEITELRIQKQNLLAEKTQLLYDLKKSSDKYDELRDHLLRAEKLFAESKRLEAQHQTEMKILQKEKNEFKKRYDEKHKAYEKLFGELTQLRENTKPGVAAKQIESENELFRKLIENLQAKFDVVSKENIKLKSELKNGAEELTELKNTLVSVDKRRTELEGICNSLKGKFASSSTIINTRENELEKLKLEKQELEKEFKTFVLKYEDLRKTVAGNAKLMEETGALKISLEKAEATNKKLSTELESLKNKHEKLNLQHETVKKTAEAGEIRKQELEKLKKINESLQSENAGLKKHMESLEKNPAKTVENKKTEEMIRKKDETIQALIEHIEDLKKTRESLLFRIAFLQKKLIPQEKKPENVKPGPTAKKPQKELANEVIYENEKKPAPVKTAAENPTSETDKKKGAVATTGKETKVEKNSNDGRLGSPSKGKKMDKELEFLIRNAEDSYKKGDLEAAIWHYKKAIEKSPDDAFLYRLLAKAQIKKGDNAKAVETLRKAYKLDSTNIPGILALAGLYLKENKTRSALSLLNSAALIAPGNSEVFLEMGRACVLLNRPDYAEKQFSKAIELKPKSPEALLEMAKLLATSFKDRKTEAQKYYLEAKRAGAERDSRLERELFGVELDKKDSKNKAVEIIREKTDRMHDLAEKEKLSLDKNTIKFLFDSAEKAEERKDCLSALWYYDKIMKMEPDNFEAMKKKGICYLKLGEKKDALFFLEKAYNKNMDDLELLKYLGPLYLKLGNYRGALNVLNLAALLAPKDPVIHRELAMACHHMGKKEHAKREFKKSLELDPDSSETLMEYARLLAEHPKTREDAEKLYKKAREKGAAEDPYLEQLLKRQEFAK